MRLHKVSLENYRFFENQEFDFKGKNVLLYGENGSGKSSLFYALNKFFQYYKNPINAKENIKKAKNIFVSDEKLPKITMTFDDGNIELTESGISNEAHKTDISTIGETKLFLTYKDIYRLNNLFKKELTYLEFKELFEALFYSELHDNFKSLEESLARIKEFIKENRADFEDKVNEIIKTILDFNETWTYELEHIAKIDSIDKDVLPNMYDTVYYLSSEYESNLGSRIEDLKLYFGFYESLSFERSEIGEALSKLESIAEEISHYTEENNRYEDAIVINNKELIESNGELDGLLETLNPTTEFAALWNQCRSHTASINQQINSKLASLKDKINELLIFLGANIKIEAISQKDYIKFDIDFIFGKVVQSVDFTLKYQDKTLDNHSENLNEAKISALNTAIYFSSVLEKQPQFPVLVLDDLLISLDMNNREKVLELLLNQTYFGENYQIIIFTHDRAFFEMARYKFDFMQKNKWHHIEMFLDEANGYEKAFVKNHEGYLELAKGHFKNKDYPATANYLRKEVEKIFSEKLNLNKLESVVELARKAENHKKFEKMFAPLITALHAFSNCEHIPPDKKEEKCKEFASKVLVAVEAVQNIAQEHDFYDINGIKDKILNPQSHYDSSEPLYKKELEDAIKAIESLQTSIGEII